MMIFIILHALNLLKYLQTLEAAAINVFFQFYFVLRLYLIKAN